MEKPLQHTPMDKSTRDNMLMAKDTVKESIPSPTVMFILVSSRQIKRMELDVWCMLIRVSTMVNGSQVISKAKECTFTPTRTCFQVTGSMEKNMVLAHMYSAQLEWNISVNGTRISSLRADGLTRTEHISRGSFRATSQRVTEHGISKTVTTLEEVTTK